MVEYTRYTKDKTLISCKNVKGGVSAEYVHRRQETAKKIYERKEMNR